MMKKGKDTDSLSNETPLTTTNCPGKNRNQFKSFAIQLTSLVRYHEK